MYQYFVHQLYKANMHKANIHSRADIYISFEAWIKIYWILHQFGKWLLKKKLWLFQDSKFWLKVTDFLNCAIPFLRGFFFFEGVRGEDVIYGMYMGLAGFLWWNPHTNISPDYPGKIIVWPVGCPNACPRPTFQGRYYLYELLVFSCVLGRFHYHSNGQFQAGQSASAPVPNVPICSLIQNRARDRLPADLLHGAAEIWNPWSSSHRDMHVEKYESDHYFLLPLVLV